MYITKNLGEAIKETVPSTNYPDEADVKNNTTATISNLAVQARLCIHLHDPQKASHGVQNS